MYIRWFKELTIKDISIVGGKNASLGEMYQKLTSEGVRIPNGFALTAEAFRHFITANKLDKKIKEVLKDLDVKNVRALSYAGNKVRQMILAAEFPTDMRNEIVLAYSELKKTSGKTNLAVAVRSSATAEDLPDASFAGQQETYLNIRGDKALLEAARKCLSSLFTDRAISYREAKGFDHFSVALSVGVQEMVRSDLSASGVMFTLDTESGFKGVVLINAAYGLGEYVVKGRVTPDQYYVFKEGIKQKYQSIISKRLGSKEVKLIYHPKGGTTQAKVKVLDQKKYALTDEEVVKLSEWGVKIEKHYGHAMDIEWAKDGETGELFIVQARSETVKSRAAINVIESYKLNKKSQILVSGSSVGQKIGAGRARLINSPKQMKDFKAGEVLVTRITDPDWEPIMRIASAIITEQGGKTSHAAIVSRELGIPCIVGAAKARQLIKPGQDITVSCAEGEEGHVYKGHLPFEVERTEIKNVPNTKTKIMMNVGDPDSAFALSAIPSDGVGLAREEFIFTNFIKIHPLALVHYRTLNKNIRAKIDQLTIGYKDKAQYCVDKLAEGIGFIASAFYPHDVIVRLSDFKTNEYATLIGGADFEPKEENPMIGWRGASRYYDPKYKPGFKLECAALKKAREEWGLKNIIIMVPFCRTVEEGKKVLATMKEFGLERGKDGLKVYMMCEIPSNVILAEEFAQIFDGFSIGSNDLTQLTLGVDRDSALVSHVYDENNAAVKKLIRDVIQVAHRNKCKVGICGQAPSDYPAFAEFLVGEGIDSISLNPDTVLKTRLRIAETEKRVGQKNILGKSATALKALLVMGIMGLMTTLSGYTCQTINDQTAVTEVKKTLATELETFKQEMRSDMINELKKQQTATYTETGFANFNLNYSNNWQVSHWSDGVKFSSPDEANYLMVFVQKMGHPVPAEKISTTTWFNYPAKRLTDGSQKDGAPYEVLEVYPLGYKKTTQIIELRGDPGSFATSLKGFTEFKVKK